MKKILLILMIFYLIPFCSALDCHSPVNENTQSLEHREKFILNNQEIKLVQIGGSAVVIDVDGTSSVVNQGEEKEIEGITIEIKGISYYSATIRAYVGPLPNRCTSIAEKEKFYAGSCWECNDKLIKAISINENEGIFEIDNKQLTLNQNLGHFIYEGLKINLASSFNQRYDDDKGYFVSLRFRDYNPPPEPEVCHEVKEEKENTYTLTQGPCQNVSKYRTKLLKINDETIEVQINSQTWILGKQKQIILNQEFTLLETNSETAKISIKDPKIMPEGCKTLAKKILKDYIIKYYGCIEYNNQLIRLIDINPQESWINIEIGNEIKMINVSKSSIIDNLIIQVKAIENGGTKNQHFALLSINDYTPIETKTQINESPNNKENQSTTQKVEVKENIPLKPIETSLFEKIMSWLESLFS